jgi:hypothetical protein
MDNYERLFIAGLALMTKHAIGNSETLLSMRLGVIMHWCGFIKKLVAAQPDSIAVNQSDQTGFSLGTA